MQLDGVAIEIVVAHAVGIRGEAFGERAHRLLP
jgi:hypothetical protein